MSQLERDIEKHAAANLEAFIASAGFAWSAHRILWARRQVTIPEAGIADLVVCWLEGDRPCLGVVEFKRETVKASTVAQLLRYMGGLRDAFEHLRAATQIRFGRSDFEYRGIVAAPWIDREAGLMILGLQERLAFVQTSAESIEIHPHAYPITSWRHTPEVAAAVLEGLRA